MSIFALVSPPKIPLVPQHTLTFQPPRSVADLALSNLTTEIDRVTTRIDELTRRKEKIEKELAELSPIALALTQAQNTVALKELSAEIESALIEGLN